MSSRSGVLDPRSDCAAIARELGTIAVRGTRRARSSSRSFARSLRRESAGCCTEPASSSRSTIRRDTRSSRSGRRP